jgi:hypothetical protein
MGWMNQLLGRIECSQCGVSVPRDSGRACPVDLSVADVIAGASGESALRRQYQADQLARQAGVGLLCSQCFSTAYEAMPAVKIIRKNELILAREQNRQLTQILMPLASTGRLSDGGIEVHLQVYVHHDEEGRLRIDRSGDR